MGELPFEKIKRERIIFEGFKFIKAAPLTTDYLLHNGIILIDKPAGPTSHQVSDQIKKILKLKKAGHSGTLDPNVTGLLPVALDKGTKVIQALLNAGKEYVCVMHVHKDIEEKKLREVIMSFVGKIRQLPPVKSAVKRQERTREVYSIEILEIKDRDVLFFVDCQGGTYIRKLCSDIGEKLGCGAHMAELRRTKAGPFNESKIINLHDLADAFHEHKNGKDTELRKIILPTEAGVKHLPKIWVKKTTVKSLSQGAQLKVVGVGAFESGIKKDDMVAVMTPENKLLLIGNSKVTSKELSNNKQGIVVKTLRVFLNN